MSPADKKLVQQAIDGLKFLDIRLAGSQFKQLDDLPAENGQKVAQQVKRGVAYKIGTQDTDGQEKKLAQILVSLGIRVVESDVEDPPTYFFIEAEFVAEYEITGKVSDDALKVFADYNAVHNVWPFWRQHVFDVVQRARLPRLEIPFFSNS